MYLNCFSLYAQPLFRVRVYVFSLFLYLCLCLQACLEDLAEKAAKEKSDAAREAFLAELELDEKTKEKKRNKENRKTKDLKV